MAVADDLDRATDSKWDWVAEHTRTYLASGGTEGHESNGVYTLVLATTGRRTGEPRRTCLIYGTSGDDFVVASRGGADQDPAWFKNLQADPSVGVEVVTPGRRSSSDGAKPLPTCRLGNLGWNAVAHRPFDAVDVAVLAAYTVVFAVLAAWRYQTDERRSIG
jgi:deazaflavin-dependent oxidoreductase (nitroreductase family)